MESQIYIWTSVKKAATAANAISALAKRSRDFDAIGGKPAVLIEAFAPPREDYLERVKSEG